MSDKQYRCELCGGVSDTLFCSDCMDLPESKCAMEIMQYTAPLAKWHTNEIVGAFKWIAERIKRHTDENTTTTGEGETE